jgi:hypothetical protein
MCGLLQNREVHFKGASPCNGGHTPGEGKAMSIFQENGYVTAVLAPAQRDGAAYTFRRSGGEHGLSF